MRSGFASLTDSQLSPQVSLMWSGAGVTAPSMPVSVEGTVRTPRRVRGSSCARKKRRRFYSAQTSWLASAQLSRRSKLSVFTPATRSNCWVG
jgi:hypothetical protein